MKDVKKYRFKGAAGEYVYAGDYEKLAAEVVKLKEDLASANADKEAYARNAIDLRKRLDKPIGTGQGEPRAY